MAMDEDAACARRFARRMLLLEALPSIIEEGGADWWRNRQWYRHYISAPLACGVWTFAEAAFLCYGNLDAVRKGVGV